MLGIVGHGLRERVVLGTLTIDGAAEIVTLRIRRYRCRACHATLAVVPRAVLYRLLYNGLAVALALSLWVVEGLSSHRIRARVSPHRGATSEREHGWRSVARWASHAERWWPWLRLDRAQARIRAHHIVQQLAGRAASASGDLAMLACEGALRG